MKHTARNAMMSALLACTAGLSLFAATPESNPLVFGNNRLTIITPTLVRLEYAIDGKFIDAPTLFAYDRSNTLSIDQIDIKELGGDCYEITTPAVRIWYHHDGVPFSTSNLKIFYQLNGKEKKFTNRFITRNNLGGPIETLDRVTKEIPLQDGILSKDGWYMIDDERADLLVDGWLQPRDTKTHIQDQYCFVYGNDYKAALASLGAISGRVPMTRKYANGVWYCRYWDYTSEEFLQIIDGYDQNDFPIDNIVFDMGWHTNDAVTGTGHNGHLNWNGYTWNRELIPDPEALIKACHERGVTVSLNDHPHDGIRPHEEVYPEFAEALGLAPDEPAPLFDLSDSNYMAKFFDYAHRPHENIGVDFWWLDWQQNYLFPYVRGYQTSSLAWINELYFKDSARDGKRPMGFSRWAGWGDHRHPIQFSGDAQANWEILAFEVKLTACSGQGGCYYWAHDIGGFRGDPNPELSARWTQFGALSACLRVHSTKNKKLDRRPWIYGEPFTDAMRKAYHLRAELMPYVYSCVWQTHNTMLPLNRSMFIDYGSQKESFDQPQEFTFGDNILAAPISTPGEGENFIASQKVWFPAGEVWYDYFTHRKFAGGQTLTISKGLDEFPMYIRGGHILPMQPYSSRPATASLDKLVMLVYPAAGDADNSFELYEDDGISDAYQRGEYATTRLQYVQKGNKAIVTVHPVEGSYDGQVKDRAYKLLLPGLKQDTKVTVNGRKAKLSIDEEKNVPCVEISKRSISKKVVIEYKFL